MKLAGTPFHFSYCLNVHPGGELADLLRVLERDLPVIRDALCEEGSFGLGLRLAHPAAEALQSLDGLYALRSQMEALNLYAFTVNAFPYGLFHGARVKEKVYAPDWRTPERLVYTRQVFRALAELLPEGICGSVSTVPLAYGSGTFTEADQARFRRHLGDLAFELAAGEAETGKTLHLGLEPEPDCLLETTAQTVHWFENELFGKGAGELAFRKGISRDRAETMLRHHIGVCFDTCHVAMVFEDPLEALRTYLRHGLRISKVQISAALECEAGPGAMRSLAAFDDGVYLHQVKSACGRAWPDLPAFFGEPPAPGERLRIHCHVPLHWPGGEMLGSTRHTLTPAFWQALHPSGCEHLEVETYTFDVLPRRLRGMSLTQNVISECTWAMASLREHAALR